MANVLLIALLVIGAVVLGFILGELAARWTRRNL